MQIAGASDGEPVAILNRNHPVFYCIPAQTYAMMMEALENTGLYSLAKQKANIARRDHDAVYQLFEQRVQHESEVKGRSSC